jgi:hypothetical protein
MRTALLCVAVVSASYASPAQAYQQTFQFTGAVTSVTGTAGFTAPWPNVGAVVGDPASLTFTFETTTADTSGAIDVGTYYNGISAVTFSMGAVSTSYVPTSSIFFLRDNVPLGYDLYEIGMNPLPGGSELKLQLVDNTSTVFTGDTLPAVLNFPAFDQRTIRATAPSGNPFNTPTVNIRLDTFAVVVPEPSLAVVPALALLGRRRLR